MPTTDSIVFISGASNGMGRLTARTLAENGYTVVAAMRDANGKNAAAADELRKVKAKTPVRVVELDVTHDASVSSGVQAALDAYGRIDVLVNCAGVMWTGITEAFTAQQLQDILNTNLVGTFRVFKAVLPAMRKQQRGLCITITSLAGRTMAPGMGIYAASKAGTEALAEIIGYEIASQNIDSVIIEPGFFQTNLLAGQREPEDKSVAEAYGPHFSPFQRVHENVTKAIMEAGVQNTDPQIIANLVRSLIETPAGRRPLRVTAGLDFCATALNEAAAPHQQQFLRLLGFRDELRVRAGE
ncbi:MAG: SDR family NAD(P)-dependent oxidoreductase [Steroidobacteraceae bacterium]